MLNNTPRAAVVRTKLAHKVVVANDLRLLVVTTHNDPSLELLVEGSMHAGFAPTVLRYASSVDKILQERYDVVYFRDPFNDTTTTELAARKTVELVVAAQPQAYYVDHVSSFQAMMLEDKWEQYLRLGGAMPHTSLLTSFDQVSDPESFVKKRISSRSRGVIFSVDDVPAGALPKDYLLQHRLEIAIEYRIFMINDQVMLPASVKSSKTTGQRSKVIGIESGISPEARALCELVHTVTGYDFMGLDIVEADGKYYLLEANRSCQFKAYHRLSGINLAEQLCQQLRTAVIT